jgi:2-hydroxychromene-2-carboxylate isomerase
MSAGIAGSLSRLAKKKGNSPAASPYAATTQIPQQVGHHHLAAAWRRNVEFCGKGKKHPIHVDPEASDFIVRNVDPTRPLIKVPKAFPIFRPL